MSQIIDGGGDSLQLNLALPCLDIGDRECWPQSDGVGSALTWQRVGSWHVGKAGDLMWLCAFGDAADATLEAVSAALYRELFTLLGNGWRLQRIWHYLPRINEPGAGGLERYRAFCSGRSRAFEMAFGKDFHAQFPAASAVGCEGDKLVVYACARYNAQVCYFENPLQTPAYRYSQAYGPRAPGFARASLTRVAGTPAEHGAAKHGAAEHGAAKYDAVEHGAADHGTAEHSVAEHAKGYSEIYLSGTASIRNERSLTAGGILGQLEITLENLNRIAAECGLEDFLQNGKADDGAATSANSEVQQQPVSGRLPPHRDRAAPPARRRFKVYLRHAVDYPRVSAHFNALLGAADEVLYVRSDICRAELDIEIEASVILGEG